MSTVLLLDAGNTRLKWALLETKEWLAEGIVDYAALETINSDLANLPAPSHILGSNVAGPAVAARIEAQLPQLPAVWLQSKAIEAGVRNLYREPGQLGPDRWAALIGTHSQNLGDTLVVMAGTAMTIDALSAEGDFLGGVIIPGFRLMREALARGTADLGLPDGKPVAFPRSTGEAIVNGAIAALTGAIAQQYTKMADQTARPIRIVLSGGDASLIASSLPAELVESLLPVDNLVLRGLACLAQNEPIQEILE